MGFQHQDVAAEASCFGLSSHRIPDLSSVYQAIVELSGEYPVSQSMKFPLQYLSFLFIMFLLRKLTREVTRKSTL